MRIAVIGRGLIGGSLEKAARRAGHETAIYAGRGPSPDVSGADVVFVALPLSATVPAVEALAAGGTLKDGALVVDVAGVKGPVSAALAKYAAGRWRFVGGHPMAGKEKTGYANSTETLFDGASMILTPYPDTPPEDVEKLRALFASLGFARTVLADPATHDRKIAYTSQLCHLVSSAYLRDELYGMHDGFSAGSFRDLTRVGAPDPEIWTELFMANREELFDAAKRFAGRMQAFCRALESGNPEAMERMLAEGVRAKEGAPEKGVFGDYEA